MMLVECTVDMIYIYNTGWCFKIVFTFLRVQLCNPIEGMSIPTEEQCLQRGGSTGLL